MENKEILEYLDEWYYTASDDELLTISEFVNGVEEDLKYFDKVDTIDVKPAHWPFAIEVDFLREDEANHILSNEDALANSSSTKDGYVKYVKVV